MAEESMKKSVSGKGNSTQTTKKRGKKVLEKDHDEADTTAKTEGLETKTDTQKSKIASILPDQS
jgi:hypothetical protein